jgi:hypothetical protein
MADGGDIVKRITISATGEGVDSTTDSVGLGGVGVATAGLVGRYARRPLACLFEPRDYRNVSFGPKATCLLRSNEMTRRAKKRLMQCSKDSAIRSDRRR